VKYFETRFLEEAEEFISELDSKAVKKIFYNIDLAAQTNDPRLLKKLKMKYGSFGQNMQDFNLGYLHFGTRQITNKL
jgi:hypothetical protein